MCSDALRIAIYPAQEVTDRSSVELSRFALDRVCERCGSIHACPNPLHCVSRSQLNAILTTPRERGLRWIDFDRGFVAALGQRDRSFNVVKYCGRPNCEYDIKLFG